MASRKRTPAANEAGNLVDLALARSRKRLVELPLRLLNDAENRILERHPALKAAPERAKLFRQLVAAVMTLTNGDGEVGYEVAHAAADALRFQRDLKRAVVLPDDPKRVDLSRLSQRGNTRRIFRPLERKRDDV